MCVMCERVVSSLAPETLKGTNVVGRGRQKTLSCSRQVKFRGHLDLCTPQCFDCPRKQIQSLEIFEGFRGETRAARGGTGGGRQWDLLKSE